MTRIEDIQELSNSQSIELPSNVVVIAQDRTMSALRSLASEMILHECELDQMPSDKVLAKAEIIVAEVDPGHDGSIRRLDEIAARCPDIPLIAGVDSLDIRTTRALLKHGVNDLLELPFSVEELLDALADLDVSDLADSKGEVRNAPTVVFFGCAGGVGTTTLATHFAGILEEEFGSSALLDLDIQKGDVSEYLGMNARLTLQDIIEADKRLDEELLRSTLSERDGMPSVLAAPQDMLPIEDITIEMLSPVTNLLRRTNDFFVVDMPSVLTNWGLSTMFSSQQIVLVGGLSVHMLRKLRRQIDFLVSMGIERDSIHVVLNRVNTGLFKTIKTSEAEEALRHPVFAVIPDAGPCVEQAQDQGELVWSLTSRTKFEKAFRGFADELIAKLEAEG